MGKIGNHAVVLGASMAGLLAARSPADFFDTVTVVERDPLPDTAAARRGVPQGRHLHGLLARGAQALEELFPGILDALVLDGANYFDGRDLSRLHYDLGGHLMAGTGSATSFTAYLVTRPFLEEHVRGRVRNIDHVTLRDEHDLALPEIDGAPTLVARLLNRYVDRVLTAAEYDTAVVNQFTRVTSLLDPATRLLRPAIMWRVACANQRRGRHGLDQRDGAAGVLADSEPRPPAGYRK